ncbi:MAG: formylmethanofuran--tetrahydromethanopterin N-formyltransferase [Gammaproteobacteria bacterium]|nr:formylmethanofuran--tetrahydromethanopterin N-formyltransferase [Gammaproteobacteria bacterium]
MRVKSTQIVDTFAEAFSMWGARVIVTAATRQWSQAAAQSMTGFATSVIGCKCEAGIERFLSPEETPDRRPGVSILLFAMDKASVGKRLLERIGQCIMTCPTTACFNGLDGEETVQVGSQLRYFGDGFQGSKKLAERRFWRIPVMDGEFTVEESFAVRKAVGGGNIIILGTNEKKTLSAAGAAVRAMETIKDIILPFPNGVVRSGSKVGSRYKTLPASTNDAYCPTLKAVTESSLPADVNCALEIVIDGLTEDAVKRAMAAGIQAAAKPGIRQVSAGNYGGNLGQYKINLHDLDLD